MSKSRIPCRIATVSSESACSAAVSETVFSAYECIARRRIAQKMSHEIRPSASHSTPSSVRTAWSSSEMTTMGSMLSFFSPSRSSSKQTEPVSSSSMTPKMLCSSTDSSFCVSADSSSSAISPSMGWCRPFRFSTCFCLMRSALKVAVTCMKLSSSTATTTCRHVHDTTAVNRMMKTHTLTTTWCVPVSSS
eukprot:2477020-Rhodomonas_salina.1